MKEEAEGWIHRAHEALQVARSLEADGFYSDAISKAYYVMFYAAKGLTTEYGKNLAKHSAVIAAFGHDFVASGQLDPELHRYIREAFVQRNEVDYTWRTTAVEQGARKQIARAEEFLGAVEELLSHPPE